MSQVLRVTCARDDVAMGDDAKPLIAKAPAAATLNDLINQVQPRFLPTVGDGADDATWVLWLHGAAGTNRLAPLAVITQSGERRFLVPARSPLLALSSDDAIYIQFDYYAQQPLDDVLLGLVPTVLV